MQQRSFFQNLVSYNICLQDPSGDPSGVGCQIFPVMLIFMHYNNHGLFLLLLRCFAVVVFVEVMTNWWVCVPLPRWKGSWNVLFASGLCSMSLQWMLDSCMDIRILLTTSKHPHVLSLVSYPLQQHLASEQLLVSRTSCHNHSLFLVSPNGMIW